MVLQIDLKQDNLPMICFYCGHMGYNEEHFKRDTPPKYGMVEINPL